MRTAGTYKLLIIVNLGDRMKNIGIKTHWIY